MSQEPNLVTQQQTLLEQETQEAKRREQQQQPKRDVRFRQILQSYVGPNGLQLLTFQSFIFVLALIIIVALMIGSMTFQMKRANDFLRNYPPEAVVITPSKI